MTEHEDRADIIAVLNLYAVALDSHAWHLFDRVFTDDVTADFGPASAEWKGVDDLTTAFELFHKTLDNHAHTMSGHVVHVDGDTAYSLTYGNWLLVRHDAEGGPTWLGTGWYDDLLVRTDRGWRIKHRISRLVAYTGNPDVPQPVGDQSPDHTGHVLRFARENEELRFFNAIQAS